MDVDNKQTLIELQIRKAKETIVDARVAIENERYRNALNRIYYSIFYIVTALSLNNNFGTSKHKQLLGWFNFNFIKNNILDVKFGDIYKTSYDNRQESDYEAVFDYDKEEIEYRFNEMLIFVNEIEQLIISGNITQKQNTRLLSF